MNHKKTLYIGAHQDDIFLGAGMQIFKNQEKPSILVLSDGVSAVKYPFSAGERIFKSPEEYFKQRESEDNAVMSALGIDFKNKYVNAKFPDGKLHKNPAGIVRIIREMVKREGVEKIVTHSIPEAHPDHEISWYCSNVVGKDLGCEVWEFVTYRINDSGENVRNFLDEKEMEKIEEHVFTEEEFKLKEKISLLYPTQKHILDKFRAKKETLGKRRKFDPSIIPITTYYYGDRKGYPSCQEIRNIMGGL